MRATILKKKEEEEEERSKHYIYPLLT
jgi:hypothetical protein